MKRPWLLVALLAGFSLPAFAELKVAVFDAAEVMAGSNAAKRAAGTLEGRVKAAQARINDLEKPLLEKQKQLREQAAVMTPDKAREAQTAFNRDLAAFRQQAQRIQGDLEDENVKLRKRISDGVRSVVEGLAQEKGYDLVLPKGLVFYSGAAVPDVTKDVLARTNALLDK
ncbi:MAG: OmpH family outer membrane protein [Alphaproteobacteria bacterium]|jgi:outer membrane protein|nr:OmpH family outer membrane protein [Alphaproteobacteria bacterium]